MIDVLSVVHHLVCLAQRAAIFDALTDQGFTQCPLVNESSIACLKLAYSTVHDNLMVTK